MTPWEYVLKCRHINNMRITGFCRDPRLIKWLFYLTGIAVFVVILSRIDLTALCKNIISVDPLFLGVAVLVQLLTCILKSERWRATLSIYQRLPFASILNVYVYGIICASVTPGKIGVGVMAPLIKNRRLSYSQIFFSILVDRALDIISIVLVGYVGLIFLKDVVGINGLLLLELGIGLLFLFLFMCYFLKRSLRKERKLVNTEDGGRGLIKRIYNKYNLIVDNISTFARNPSRNLLKIFLEINIINALHYFFYFVTLYFIVLSIGLDVSFVFILLSYSVVALLGMLPISISGIGTRDISLIFFFNLIGIPAEKAIAVSMVDLIVVKYGTVFVLFGILNIARIFHGKSNLEINVPKK